jgi:hypothetical protein
VLAIHRSGVEPPPVPVHAYANGLGEVIGDPQVHRQEVRRAGWQDRHGHARPRHRVDAALDGTVATPDEQHVSTLRHGAASVFGRESALGHLVPDRIGDALLR